jgi:uncharacterized protein DUF4190/uncharacterized protein DUF4333
MTSTAQPPSPRFPQPAPQEWQYPQYQQPAGYPQPARYPEPEGYATAYPAAGPPPWSPPPMPGPAPAPSRTSTAAVLALVFAFVFAPLGIVFGLIGRRRTRRTGEGGRGLATAGLLLGTVFTVLGIVAMLTMVGVLSQTASALAGQIGSAQQESAQQESAQQESAQRTAGASSSGLVIRKAAIETRVATLLQPALGRAPSNVTCAGDLVNPQAGSTTRCRITMSDGTSAGSTITVNGVTGTDVALTVQVDALTVFQSELETMVADNLQRQTGARPASVSCPGDLVNPQAGMTTHCTATNTDGSGTGVTITVTKVAGSQVGINARTDGTS